MFNKLINWKWTCTLFRLTEITYWDNNSSRIQTTQLFCLDLQGVQHQSLPNWPKSLLKTDLSNYFLICHVNGWGLVNCRQPKYLIKVKKSLSSWLKEAIVNHWQELEQNHSLQETHHNLFRCNNMQTSVTIVTVRLLTWKMYTYCTSFQAFEQITNTAIFQWWKSWILTRMSISTILHNDAR